MATLAESRKKRMIKREAQRMEKELAKIEKRVIVLRNLMSIMETRVVSELDSVLNQIEIWVKEKRYGLNL